MRTVECSSLKVLSFFTFCFLGTAFDAPAFMPYGSPIMTPQQMQMQLMAAQNQGGVSPQNGMPPNNGGFPPQNGMPYPSNGGFPPYPGQPQMGGTTQANPDFDVPATETSEEKPSDLKNILKSLKEALPPELKDKALDALQNSLGNAPPPQPDGSADNMPPIGVPNSMLPYNGPMPNLETTPSAAPPVYAENSLPICTCECPQHGAKKTTENSLSEPISTNIQTCEKQALTLPGDKEYSILAMGSSKDGQNYSQQQMWILPAGRDHMIFSVPSTQDVTDEMMNQQAMILPPHMPPMPVQLPIQVPY